MIACAESGTYIFPRFMTMCLRSSVCWQMQWQGKQNHATRHADSPLSADNSCFKSAYARKARIRVCKCNWERPSRTRQTGLKPTLAILILMLIVSNGAKRQKRCSFLFCSC